ncbi:MAG: SWIM zinc finger family protein [bacterium]
MNFSDLTWEDLKDWAGDRVVSRGKSYTRRVEDLRVTVEGALLAWVQGHDRYATLVRRDTKGQLASTCSCPYGEACKHAVAVILVYLDEGKNNRTPPPAIPDDERLAELTGLDDDLDDDAVSDVAPPASREDEPVRKHLEGLSKTELVDLLLEGRNIVPELRQRLSDKAELEEGNVAKLIASTRREIENASREPGWTNHWKGERHIPDYSRVKQRLETLLAAGQADAVVEIGAYLMDRGIQQIGQSHDEGETGMEIAEAMAVVFQAVGRSSLSISQRLLWEIDLRLKDEYSILDRLTGPLAAGKSGHRSDWSVVADALAARLAKMPEQPAGTKIDFSSKHKREQVMRWLLRAMEQAGRHDEVIPILECEAAQTQCYVELVKKLAESGRTDKAREWAKTGFGETSEHAPGIAWQLEEQLRELAAREKNAPLVAAYRVMEFFDKPSVEHYAQLEEAAAKAGVWEAIRGPILLYLETGRRPDVAAADAERPKTKPLRKNSSRTSAVPAWPLPSPELPARDKDARWTRFPDTSTLVDIAIKEGRHDDALRWYRAGKKPGGFGIDYQGDTVAQAVQVSHPDEALAIWKETVAREIAHAKPAAYEVAGGYLKKMRGVYECAKRTAEWSGYLGELRQQNSRRPRMIEVLNSLEGRRTPIV